MSKVGRTISFDTNLLYEYTKRNINLNELINRLLSVRLEVIFIEEQLLKDELVKREIEKEKKV